MHISTGNGVGCEAFRLSGFTTRTNLKSSGQIWEKN